MSESQDRRGSLEEGFLCERERALFSPARLKTPRACLHSLLGSLHLVLCRERRRDDDDDERDVASTVTNPPQVRVMQTEKDSEISRILLHLLSLLVVCDKS